jgi:hypothetical protein
MRERTAGFVAISSLFLLSGCSGESDSGKPGGSAGTGGSTSAPFGRYEPDQRLDNDNVSDPAGVPLGVLKLPDPPKSGFRLIAPPLALAPGQEVETCVAWPYPAFTHKNVYAARLYTTQGLHHSNMYGTVKDAVLGDSPYPGCNPGANDPFGDIPASIPEVLFANSTQVKGGEGVEFPEGMAFKVDTTREVATSIHYLNASNENVTVEVVYDFFTMPDELLENEIVPFVFDIRGFTVAPSSVEELSAECQVYGGNVVSLMPHNHSFTQGFHVELIKGDGAEERIYDTGGFNTDSDIRVYDPPIPLTNVTKVRHTCRVENTTSHEIKYGIGENEMCMLFGYQYPKDSQVAGIKLGDGQSCISVNVAQFGK